MGYQVLRESLAYALCDALHMSIHSTRVDPQLKGEKTVELDLGGLKIPVKAKIVSSWLTGSVHMAMLKVMGNMAMLACARQGRSKPVVDIFILNLAKMGRAEDWLDAHRPKSVDEARQLLGKAVVRAFTREGTGVWHAA